MQLKRLTLLSMAALGGIALLIGSCSKSNNNNSNNSAAVTANLGGTVFTPAIPLAYYSESLQTYEVGGYTVKSNDTTALLITIPGPVTVNATMNANTSNISLQYYLNGSNGKAYIAGGGSGFGSLNLKVTSLDTVGYKIAGTFTGSMYASPTDSIVVTNGSFNTTYLIEP